MDRINKSEEARVESSIEQFEQLKLVDRLEIMKQQMETRVLLVTLANNVNNTVLQHNKYYQAFSKYGEVQRVSPFSTFIEMDSIENARKARLELNNTQILADGTKMLVLPSQKQRIEFQEKNTAGLDYSKLKQIIIEKQLNQETEDLIEKMLNFDDVIEEPEKKCSNLKNKILTSTTDSNENNGSQYSCRFSSNSTENSGSGQSCIKGLKKAYSQNQKSSQSKTSQKDSFQLFLSQEDMTIDNQSNKTNNSSIIKDNNNNSNSNLSLQTSNDSSIGNHQATDLIVNQINNEFNELNLAQSVYKGDIEQNQSFQTHKQGEQISSQKNYQRKLNLVDPYGSIQMQFPSSRNTKVEQLNSKTTNMFNSAPISTTTNRTSPQNLKSDLYESVDENTQLSSFIHPQFSQITKKSKVIYANRFEASKTTIEQIFNLFSSFGNIEKIIFLKGKSAVLIEYANIENACFAKDYLSDTIFNGNMIKLFYSRYDNVFFKSPEEKPADEEYFEPNEKMNRFKPDAQAVVNPPIDTLHISNLRRESCIFEVIKNVFQPYGMIKNVKFMLEKNNKNMCLVKFDNSSVAMWALANVHNQKVNDRPLKISFSKRTLE